jgi:hypothetical protein
LFGASGASLQAKLNLKDSRLELEHCDISRAGDFLRARGEADMRGGHSYSGTVGLSLSRLADYSGWLSSTLGVENTAGGFTLSATASGTAAAHRVEFELRTSELQFDFGTSEKPRVSASALSASSHGDVNFKAGEDIRIRLLPNQSFAVESADSADCIGSVQLKDAAPPLRKRPVTEFDLRRAAATSAWTISLPPDRNALTFCTEGPALVFAPVATTR